MTTTPAHEDVLPDDAIEHLRNHQRQLDMDGCEVGVSRQALDEVLDYITRTRAIADGVGAELKHRLERERSFAKSSQWQHNYHHGHAMGRFSMMLEIIELLTPPQADERRNEVSRPTDEE